MEIAQLAIKAQNLWGPVLTHLLILKIGTVVKTGCQFKWTAFK